jgi:hypothetical protein
VYEEDLHFPRNRAELYERGVETLLNKWDTSRQIKRDEKYKQLSLVRKKQLLAHLAWPTFRVNQYFIRAATLEEHIRAYLANLPGSKPEDLEVDARDVLQAMEANHGLIVQRAQGIYSFSHLTFQEFFTACYVRDHQAEALPVMVHEGLLERRWRETFLLTTNLLPDAGQLFILLNQAKDKQLKECTMLNTYLTTLYNITSISDSRRVVLLGALISCIYPILKQPFSRTEEHKYKSGGMILHNIMSLHITYDKDIFIIKINDFLFFNRLFNDNGELKSVIDTPDKEIVTVLRDGRFLIGERNYPIMPLDDNASMMLSNYIGCCARIAECLDTESYISKDLRKEIEAGLFMPILEEEDTE